MAVLTSDQLTHLRQQVASDGVAIAYTKANLNDAAQAIENYFETTARVALNTAINAATTPVVLAAPVKAALVKHYLRQKFERGG